MSSSQFFLTLPSNSSLNFYPENSLSSFTTKLSQSLVTENRYEVGLAEIMYPHSWDNVRRGGNGVYYRSKPGSPVFSLRIPEGYYKEVNTVIEAIHNIIKKYDAQALSNVCLKQEDLSQKVRVEVKNGAGFAVDDDIAIILGLPIAATTMITSTITGERIANVDQGLYSLYVYTDLVEEQVIGDTRAPLLRIVPVEGKHGDFVTKTYERPQYVPVEKTLIDSIQIDLRDDIGHKIHFEGGKVVITLHFRLLQSPNFA